jgi:signal transduction histidine kinase
MQTRGQLLAIFLQLGFGKQMAQDFQADIDTIVRVPAVPTILDVICSTTGMGFAAVARVTDERWIACGVKDTIRFGLQPGGELKVETTICHEIRQYGQVVVIDHVAAHEVFCSHPTPSQYGFQSYISVPIVLPDGRFFGTLCAIDPEPRVLNTPTVIGMFRLFAEMIAFQIDAQERMAASEADLLEEREVSELREQFIAVLGHDLRNPLASISAGMRALQRTPLDEKASGIVHLVQNSVRRMSRLIDDVLDLARGRLAGGIPLTHGNDGALETVLHQVFDEAVMSWPQRRIEVEFDLQEAVCCDSSRIGQLCSNLLGNAIAHGAPDMPIRARVTAKDGLFRLTVANGGEPIPHLALGKLFQPFFRGVVRPGQQGLGLGLYIAAEIARGHGGDLSVTSTPAETRFIFKMPTTPG